MIPMLPCNRLWNISLGLVLSTVGALQGAAIEKSAFEGTIVAVDRDRGTLQLKPEDGGETVVAAAIPGDIRIAEPGKIIRGEIFSYGDGFRIETIWPNDPMRRSIVERLGRRLRQDTEIRSPHPFRGIGETLPLFALYNQRGDVFESRSVHGEAVMINFIFTRCRSPEMCPASTERMKRLHERVEDADIEGVRFLSITLDPEYDTPGVFSDYADASGISAENFMFLTGPTGIVEDLKSQLGILAEPDKDQLIRHTLMTILVDRSGKIVHQVPGSFWSVDDMFDRIVAMSPGE